MYILPAFKEDTMVKPGRGKGGLSTIWKKGLTKYVSKIKCDIFRIQATKFNFPNAELLVLNLYFIWWIPKIRTWMIWNYYFFLSEIDKILSTSECKNVLLIGDINVIFLDKHNLCKVLEHLQRRKAYIFSWICQIMIELKK